VPRRLALGLSWLMTLYIFANLPTWWCCPSPDPERSVRPGGGGGVRGDISRHRCHPDRRRLRIWLRRPYGMIRSGVARLFRQLWTDCSSSGPPRSMGQGAARLFACSPVGGGVLVLARTYTPATGHSRQSLQQPLGLRVSAALVLLHSHHRGVLFLLAAPPAWATPLSRWAIRGTCAPTRRRCVILGVLLLYRPATPVPRLVIVLIGVARLFRLPRQRARASLRCCGGIEASIDCRPVGDLNSWIWWRIPPSRLNNASISGLPPTPPHRIANGRI